MSKGFFVRSIICILFFGFCLYSYLDMQNEVTELRIRVPHLTREVRRIEEENTHLQFEIEAFESPENLMRIAQRSEFSHLRFPFSQDVLTLRQANPLRSMEGETLPDLKTKPNVTFATGANP